MLASYFVSLALLPQFILISLGQCLPFVNAIVIINRTIGGSFNSIFNRVTN